jgi:hypothetical protein
MDKKFEKKLIALAKEYGYLIITKCCYCSEYSEYRPDEKETQYYLTIIKPDKEVVQND